MSKTIRRLFLGFVTSWLAFAPAGLAASWNGALLAFQRKAQSKEKLDAARQLFEDLYATRPDARERLRAAEYLVRLDVYASAQYGGNDVPYARALAERCWKTTVRKFAPLGVPGETAGAHWKALCIGLWADTFSGLSRLQVVDTMRGEFLPLVQKLERADPAYLAGGPLRVLAVFHSTKLADRLQDGSYDPDLAQREVESALSLSAETSSLPYFMNVATKCMVLEGIGRLEEARRLKQRTVAAIGENLQQADHDPETSDELRVLADQLSRRNQ